MSGLSSVPQLGLEDARRIASAARAKAIVEGWNVVIAIVDDGGHLILLERADGTQKASVIVAQEKARTAILFKRPTKALEDAIAGGRQVMLALPGATPIEGGLPLVSGRRALRGGDRRLRCAKQPGRPGGRRRRRGALSHAVGRQHGIEQYLERTAARAPGPVMRELHARLSAALPAGFQACMSYGMIGYVVPHTLYPAGYHCDPKLPLPFLSLGLAEGLDQSSITWAIYADPELLAWFQAEHAKASPRKLDMGKSCIRYKKPDDIPFALLEQLAARWTPADWIARYEAQLKR